MSQTVAGIPGITFTGTVPNEPPIILVVGPEKIGKSTTAISLIDWPRPGAQPLIIAFDAGGPDSCAQLGYQMSVLKVKDQPGINMSDKTIRAAEIVARAFKSAPRDQYPYTSIVIDCASTLVDKLFADALPRYKSQLQVYGEVKNVAERFFGIITEIGVPTIWYAWLKEPYEDNKTKKLMEGGAKITGAFKNTLAGRATNIVMLDREKHGVGAVGADAQGYVRMFHTRTYNNIALGGRYALPEPCPPHLGMILQTIMGGIHQPQATQIQNGMQEPVQMQQQP